MDMILVALMAFYFFYITVIGFTMFSMRVRSVRAGKAPLSYFRDYQDKIPQKLKMIENHYNNQFQAPMVFMIVGTLALALSLNSRLFVVLSAAFVISRLAHTYFHLFGKNVLYRGYSYMLNLFIIGLLWVTLLSSMIKAS